MGYNINRFIDRNEITEDFICHTCENVIESPLQINAECEHIFCAVCIKSRLKQNINKCPVDGQAIEEPNVKKPSKFWLRKYESLMIGCYFNAKGCKEIRAIRELSIHEINCEYNPNAIIQCEKECGASFARKDQFKHSCLPYLKSLIDETKKVNYKPVAAESGDRVESQVYDFSRVEELLNLYRKELDQLKANPVPIGFTYFQLPEQPEPAEQWPNVKWTDVSAKYGGLFFRVAGGESALFGQIQAESAPRLQSVEADLIDEEISMIKINVPPNGEWSDYIHSDIGNVGGGNERVSLRFKMSTDEVRPRNFAIRVWQRTA